LQSSFEIIQSLIEYGANVNFKFEGCNIFYHFKNNYGNIPFDVIKLVILAGFTNFTK